MKKEKQLKSDIGCFKNWVGKIEKISSYVNFFFFKKKKNARVNENALGAFGSM